MVRWLAPLLILLAAPPLKAETLTVALSSNVIAIGSNFSGATLSLFGVVERDANTVARSGSYEIIIAVRGPEQNVLVQRRERRFGIWMNGKGEEFDRMPSYYGLFSTPGARGLIEDAGGPARSLSLISVEDDGDRRAEHRAALAAARMSQGLYVEELDGVEKLSRTFFRTEIPLPPLLSDGRYRVFAFLYAGEVNLATEELRFDVHKTGFEQRVFQWSREQPLFYGLGAVVLALVTGYVGGVVFRRG
ncbi:TIGR02186 family protein [Acuticoccus yangtzensis]|uniref:TIGR02186 family protein n=1 Tax=Acuticoccus yangtzensis TaxID=1443441 RepID=UPI0009495853|nr:TIGR02186 family protein [Acuticoccus yangtzensis]ORE96668.1 hypothetical protein ATO13_07380 [Stappia sp. 22II-S9-Z10]